MMMANDADDDDDGENDNLDDICDLVGKIVRCCGKYWIIPN